ncbi:phosphoribosylformylglycinamidine cyclo-ligase [Deferribacterales bacterium RsTz2092]|nr:phosphoribosylformylglycinamidine cyclo-ligase [Deferribacterales bacterium]
MSGTSYSDSGVNINAGNEFVEQIKPIVKTTFDAYVPSGLGGFAAFYDIARFKAMSEPMLVSSTDGVGTKLKVAIEAGVYNSVGIDLVAMSVNDLVVCGARPLVFLDYFATGRLDVSAAVEVLRGVAEGCRQAGTSLVGGETAEMPGMYAKGDFDLAGFAVGIVDKPNIIDGKNIKADDIVVGLASSGFHSNGYSLLRKILADRLMSVNDLIPTYGTVQELLLTPTKIYVKAVLAALEAGVKIKGMVHITGGGFYDNIPRVLPKDVDVVLDNSAFPQVPAIEAFRTLTDTDEHELYRTFNMGVGYVFIIDESEFGKLSIALAPFGELTYKIGKVVSGKREVHIKGVDL